MLWDAKDDFASGLAPQVQSCGYDQGGKPAITGAICWRAKTSTNIAVAVRAIESARGWAEPHP